MKRQAGCEIDQQDEKAIENTVANALFSVAGAVGKKRYRHRYHGKHTGCEQGNEPAGNTQKEDSKQSFVRCFFATTVGQRLCQVHRCQLHRVGCTTGAAFQCKTALLFHGVKLIAFRGEPINLNRKFGGWMDVVKKVLAFVELALAFKFLSNADLVKQWGLLKREVFIAIWIIIGIGIVAYLLGLIRFKNAKPRLTKTRLAIAGIFTIFTLYLVPGLTNSRWANLHLISGRLIKNDA